MTLGALIGGPVGFLALPSIYIILQMVSGTKPLLGNAFSLYQRFRCLALYVLGLRAFERAINLSLLFGRWPHRRSPV